MRKRVRREEEAVKINALLPWYGSNRLLAEKVGLALRGAKWVGIPFAGGMSELVHIDARTIVVNDVHRLAINLARVVADPQMGPILYRQLRRKIFHPDEIAKAQAKAEALSSENLELADWEWQIEAAEAYFVACWMGRSANAGTPSEFRGNLSTRWNAGGGDSATRYANAVRSLPAWRRLMRRCNFETLDAFEFIGRAHDREDSAIYCDPPFLGPGTKYRFNFGKGIEDQIAAHTSLAVRLQRFEKTRVVCRFYASSEMRAIYDRSRWDWEEYEGRSQSNDARPEVLATLKPAAERLDAKPQSQLF